MEVPLTDLNAVFAELDGLYCEMLWTIFGDEHWQKRKKKHQELRMRIQRIIADNREILTTHLANELKAFGESKDPVRLLCEKMDLKWKVAFDVRRSIS